MELNTKEKILLSSLELFSLKGFDGVGVDEIAAKAGIKGPSIYRYFKGKDEILNALIDKLELSYNENIKKLNLDYIPTTKLEFVNQAMEHINYTINNELIIKSRKLLAIEQFRNDRIKKLATEHYIAIPTKMYKDIIEKMIAMKYLKKYNPELLSFELGMPIASLIHLADREPDKKDFAIKIIKSHLEHFINVYGLDIK